MHPSGHPRVLPFYRRLTNPWSSPRISCLPSYNRESRLSPFLIQSLTYFTLEGPTKLFNLLLPFVVYLAKRDETFCVRRKKDVSSFVSSSRRSIFRLIRKKRKKYTRTTPGIFIFARMSINKRSDVPRWSSSAARHDFERKDIRRQSLKVAKEDSEEGYRKAENFKRSRSFLNGGETGDVRTVDHFCLLRSSCFFFFFILFFSFLLIASLVAS